VKAAQGLRLDSPRGVLRVGALLLAVATLGLAGASRAEAAGFAEISEGVLVVTGGDVDFSKIQVRPAGSGAEWIVTDEHDTFVAGPGCAQLGEDVTCPRAGTTSLEVSTGDLKDHVRATVDIPATIRLGTGPDQTRGGSANDYLDGGPGPDNLEGRDGVDILDGGDDRDTALYVERGAAQPVDVTLDGLANDGGAEDNFSDHILANVENVNATPGDDVIVGDDGPNRLTGGAGVDQITAGGGDDALFGQGDNDALSGEGGADLLDGGDGADTHDGGSENDRVLYETRTASQPVTVTLDGNANDGGAVDGNDDNVLTNVENVTGGAGSDVLVGNAGPNSLNGDEGADTLDGGAGADTLEGGSERDVATYANRGAADAVDVSLDDAANDGGAIDGGGHDNIRATVERVLGGAGNDELTGSAAANTLTGNAGADALNGAGGADTLLGGAGVDALTGAADRDSLDGGIDADSLDGGEGRDVARYESRTAAQPVTVTLDGVADDGGAVDGFADDLLDVESVVGGAGDDSLTGNGVTNVLTGNGGEDELHGLAGNDELRASGDGFDDAITCGAGAGDRLFADATDSFPVVGPDACEVVN
jgi:Ca2+-binding RTX toxin-like protein